MTQLECITEKLDLFPGNMTIFILQEALPTCFFLLTPDLREFRMFLTFFQVNVILLNRFDHPCNASLHYYEALAKG